VIRTFIHSFDPPVDSPVTGSTVALTVEQIEDAGIKEILQTPGAALGTWALLDALLQPTGAGTPFLFREPLGQSREVKVALSGLFGRFVARAYLERYLGLSVFAHLSKRYLVLHRRKRLQIVRREKGDLPDWIAWRPNDPYPTFAEAKGCHDAGGPDQALGRAWALSIQGNIKAVRSLVEPLQVAMDNGAKRALIPLENKRSFLEVTGDVMEHVDPIFFSDPKTAAFKALGLN
jgi:hypothetical protein